MTDNPSESNRYDQLAYPSKAYAYARPDRLWAMAKLFGMSPVDPARSRVLELGCGAGGHLLPLAASLPGADFVGFDLAETAVAEARERSSALGLTNVRFERRNILEIDEDLGEFDYIIAHGVFSWVPEDVREALMALCGRFLSSQGVAYISYNTQPGWRLRGAVRDVMRVHGEHFDTPLDQVTQGLAMVSLIAEHMAPTQDPYGGTLAREMAKVQGHTPAYYFHDFLAPVNDPLLFRDFVAIAARHGLAYLGEASLADMMPENLPAELRDKLNELAPDLVMQQQYYDLAQGTAFRRSLLVRPQPLQRDLSGEDLRGMHLTSSGGPEEGTLSLGNDDPATFVSRQDAKIKVRGRLGKAALLYLFTQQPRGISFEDVHRVALSWTDVDLDEEQQLHQLGGILLHAFRAGLVELGPAREGLPEGQPERPYALRLVRTMAAEHAEHVPNVRNEMVHLTRMDQVLVTLLTGEYDLEGLVGEMITAALEGRVDVKVAGELTSDVAVIRDAMTQAVPARLRRLYEASLIVDRDFYEA